MTCLNRLLIASVVAVGLAGPMVLCAHAQQNANEPAPRPAGQTFPGVLYPDQLPDGDQGSPPRLEPDNQPLTGVQNPTLGAPRIVHSFWAPGVQYSNVAASTTLDQATPSAWNTTSYLVGSLGLLQKWARAQLSVNYAGGAYFSSDDKRDSGTLQ